MRNVAALAVLIRFNYDSWQWFTFWPPCILYLTHMDCSFMSNSIWNTNIKRTN